MRWSRVLVTAFFGTGLVVYLGSTAACGGSGSGSGFGGSSGGGSGGSGGSSGAGSSSGNSGGSSGGCGITGCGSSSGGSSGGGHNDGGVACPQGLQCGVSCSGGGTTSISGVVFDPAGADPLYDIAVYVPAVPLVALPKGVASDACNCASLYKSGAVVATTTGVDGSFKLDNAPVGSNVPLVMQIGKWRKQVMINVTACTNNTQPAGSLKLPGSIPAGDTNDNMPDIAVSTGGADTLECLMSRIGLPSSEYSAGAGGAGHVHVFSGGNPGGGGGGGQVGRPEAGWQGAGAPESDTTLWNSQASLMPYDIVLLSCEGGETYNANPPVLESYLNAGGRAFGSHFHYAWFSGPLGSTQGYSAPSDWGTNLASWAPGSGNGNGNLGDIVQTLNGSTQPFAKGVALYQWLGLNGALQAMKLPITQPKFNAIVGPGNKPSQPWINYDQNAAGNTAYFSFDTPVNAPVPADGGAPAYCGRAVFSDLHVSGADPSPSCNPGPLSPQEKALEFMLFDLSSCVIPDNVPPTADGGVPPVFQ